MLKLNLYVSLLAMTLSAGIITADPAFNLKNKSSDAIQLDIIQNGKSLTGLKSVKANGDFSLETMDLAATTLIEIYFCPTRDWCKTQLPEKLVARVEIGKNIYIKFTGAGLQVQKGALGLTTKGYSLKNVAQIMSQDFYVGSMRGNKKEYTRTSKPTASKKTSPTQTSPAIPQKTPAIQLVAPSKNTAIVSSKPLKSTDIVPLTSTPSAKSIEVFATPPSEKIVPVGYITGQATQEALAQASKTNLPSASVAAELQEASTVPLTAAQKTGPYNTETGPLIQPAIRIAPTAPASKKAQTDMVAGSGKSGLQESSIPEKISPSETQTVKPVSKELAWQEFPEANRLRKKLKNGDQSPFVARKVLGLDIGASESAIKNGANKLENFYKSRSYRGDVMLVPDIVTIITSAKDTLVDAIYPTLSNATMSPFQRELQKLFYEAPDGFEEFAAPIYQDLISTKQYSRDFLQTIQKKIMANKGLPEKWRQAVLSKLQRELSRIK